MMKPIKFRGKRLDNGELICGDLVHYGKYETCIRSYLFPDKNSFSTLPVDSNSIAQLVGYDADGKEVYEGDALVDEDGNEFSVVLAVRDNSTGEFLPITDSFRILDYKLKETVANEKD